MFNETSRYHSLETEQIPTADGRSIAYVRRRFLPPPAQLATLMERTATSADRLDLITAETLGDPEQFWRICDANSTMNPAELLADPIQTIRIPAPQF
ncbi:hypothetical protein [Leptolyngbya ohadii]|uniref:hypothetical protein n=1 Tax=Leptolyngbya ohadii TaxID=1962290 RepID=UPI000B59ADB7|nr:hypothetical protein [Leptolyngbya ohadii]